MAKLLRNLLSVFVHITNNHVSAHLDTRARAHVHVNRLRFGRSWERARVCVCVVPLLGPTRRCWITDSTRGVCVCVCVCARALVLARALAKNCDPPRDKRLAAFGHVVCVGVRVWATQSSLCIAGSVYAAFPQGFNESFLLDNYTPFSFILQILHRTHPHTQALDVCLNIHHAYWFI